MGWGYRKSISLGKGVRLNVSKRGVGVSAGVKGFRVGTGPSGSRMRATLPGTGLYYEKRLGSKTRKKGNTSPQFIKEVNKQSVYDAGSEVEQYEEFIHAITTLHKAPVKSVDWNAILEEDPPFDEKTAGPNEQEAMEKLMSFKPSMMDKLFSRAEARRQVLQGKVLDAKIADRELLSKWKRKTHLAERVLAGDDQALISAFEEVGPFQEVLKFGGRISAYTTTDNDIINIEFNTNYEDVIPTETKSFTAAGNVSTRKMGVNRYNEFLHSYVTGSAILIARESFSILPVDKVYVHCVNIAINPSTGVEEEDVLLSALFDREQIEAIVYENIKPGETLKLFKHHMKFLKTKGFQPVTILEGE